MDVLVTCRTPGCINEGEEIPVNTPAGVGVTCGVCQKDIEEVRTP